MPTQYENFDSLIQTLHAGQGVVKEAVSESSDSNIIIVNEKRRFQASEDFNTEIAYEGDIHSQIITFKLPKFQDSHILAECQFKDLRWKNLSSGMEGTSPLKRVEAQELETAFYAQWEVPPEICTQSGKIELSISIYDKDTDGQIAYSWNTAKYTELSIASSMDSVNYSFPAKNEILVIDKDTKQILAPKGYNNTVCLYGDVGVGSVYFLVNRFVGKNSSLDTLTAKTAIYIVIKGYRRKYIFGETDNLSTKKLYTPDIANNEDALVFIEWKVPAEITANELFGAAEMKISIEFSEKENDGNGEEIITKRWFSNTYNNLAIGKSLIQEQEAPDAPSITEEKIFSLIDKYFDVHEIIFESE